MHICAVLLVLQLVLVINTKTDYTEFLVYTVATERNDAFERFLRSAELNGFHVNILGENSRWLGGNVALSTGGGYKVNLLKEELSKYEDRNDVLVLFVDSYDVVFMHEKYKLLKEYMDIGAKVLFSAEKFCWPQKNLTDLYPNVGPGENRFLNSGGFIGPASLLYTILNHSPIKNDDDDQLYYTNIFLDSQMRTALDIQLDRRSRIFQNLNGALSEVELRFSDETGYLFNKIYETMPLIAHGNGPIKEKFNSLSNYLAYSWTPTLGCQHCQDSNIHLDEVEDFPVIVLGVFIEYPTPFLERFFERIATLTYPKSKIHMVGHFGKSAAFQEKIANAFNESYGNQYKSVTWLNDESEIAARKKVYAYCLAVESCKFVFSIDGAAQLTEPDTIKHLISSNRSIIAPLLARRGKAWSNFWGALDDRGFYARSNDYIDILNGDKKGIWNVPFIREAYLLSRSATRKLAGAKLGPEVDMSIAEEARNQNIFMYVDNRKEFGYLININNYTTEHLHNDLWEIFDNPMDWEEIYINPGYFNVSAEKVKMADITQPCPDVFWFPLLSEKFCKQLIEEMEYYGQWSNGDNYDSRLEGGYENVPTRDIHMRQVDWENHWIHVLRTYVYPMQKKLFEGYEDRPWARMNFVVRYKPDEQASLRPHHDASSYTLNIGLNRPGIDYQGGGVRFVRYDCSVIETKVGWVLMNPGRVTHLHEGLKTTKGTRYIFVTFVNP